MSGESGRLQAEGGHHIFLLDVLTIFGCIDCNFCCLFLKVVVCEVLAVLSCPCFSKTCVRILSVTKRGAQAVLLHKVLFYLRNFRIICDCYDMFVKLIVLAYSFVSLNTHSSLLFYSQKLYPIPYMTITEYFHGRFSTVDVILER
jgi:hypothetical protein